MVYIHMEDLVVYYMSPAFSSLAGLEIPSRILGFINFPTCTLTSSLHCVQKVSPTKAVQEDLTRLINPKRGKYSLLRLTCLVLFYIFRHSFHFLCVFPRSSSIYKRLFGINKINDNIFVKLSSY